MSNDENFPPLPSKKPPDPPDSNMDTEHTPITDRERCERMSVLEEETQLMLDRINFLELTLARMRNGKVQKPKHDFDQINKELDDHMNHLEHQKGELLSLGSCPIPENRMKRKL
ncbi:hypothetical protein TNCV_2717711 [Trichonephila clavipes]|nr:hypothetical protein TNCV_2717711 [Trichonephila clavipes]